MRLSVVVPARNEAALIGGTVRALLEAAARLPRPRDVEIVIVDNASTDDTAAITRSFGSSGIVRLVRAAVQGAARARNVGARACSGEVLVFVDADTLVPPNALTRISELHGSFDAGIFRLAALDGGLRARIWWTFWEHVRRLPLSYAKAMPAFMFCTRPVFEEFGPFDEEVSIAEEWPILAGLHRARRGRFIYDRTLTAHSSSRRMEMQRCGYARNLSKYAWAVLHRSGRLHYTDRFRAAATTSR
jgi:glycosyltransferase involved in cell wall biosynthesis